MRDLSLKNQRRLAAKLLNVGSDRIWIDPDEHDRVSSAITRREVRALIHEGAIMSGSEAGISRGRKRERHSKLRIGRRRGAGSRKGVRMTAEEEWLQRIRALRRRLRGLRDSRVIERSVYRKLLLKAKGGAFRDVAHLDEHIEGQKLARRRGS